MSLRSILALLLSIAVVGCATRVDPEHATPPLDDAPVVETAEADNDGEFEEEEDAEAKAMNPAGMTSRWLRRLNEDGSLPTANIARMVSERDRMSLLAGGPGLTNWTWHGPGNIGGRIRSIVIHPTQPSTMWAGSAGGGIWKTTNGGASWAPLDNFPNVFAIGCLALDPRNPNRIFAGTGEGVFNSVPGTSNLAAPRGAGIWLSIDGGTNWSQIASTNTPDWYFVNRIVFDPNNANTMLAATETGIWRSTDSGANWTRTTANRAYYDVNYHPTNSSIVIAGGRDTQASYSTNGGLTWLFASGFSSPQRAEVEFARSSPNLVYAAVSSGGRIRLYESTDTGRTYSLKSQGSGIQTWSRYNNTLWVDPFNPQFILIGGVPLHRSVDGGQVFTREDSGVHVDHHWLVEHPQYNGTTNAIVYNGNDGGIYRANNIRAGNVSWTNLNNNLGVTQFYGGAIAPNGTLVGGTQDNGTMRSGANPNSWVRFFGGDGGFAAADPTDSNFVYGEVQNLRIFRSTNGGQSASYIWQGINESDPNFIPPFILDPNDPNTMLAAGARLWRTTNVKSTTSTIVWAVSKPAITCTPLAPTHPRSHFAIDPPCNISAVTVAEGNSDIAWVGHNNGDVYMTTTATTSSLGWTRVDTNGTGLPNRWISRIAIDPRDNNVVYVSLMGYQPDNVWRTGDAGQSWTRITGTGSTALPSAPATSVAVHPRVAGWLYVGTDVGVFCSDDDGATWSPTTTAGGRSPAEELVWQNDRRLVIVTHGRGMYSADTGPAASTTVRGQGCGLVGPVSLFASAPKPGTTQTYQLSSASPNRPVWLGISPGAAVQTPLGNNCSLWMNLAGIALIPSGTTNAVGVWSLQLPLPPIGTLVGAQFHAQALVQVPSGPAFGNAELSNGVDMTIGF